MSRETIMLIGIGISVLLGGLNYFSTKKGVYINTVSAERIKWINKLREHFSDYSNMVYIYANAVEDYNNKEIAPEEFNEKNLNDDIVYKTTMIELYLNPTEKMNLVLMDLHTIMLQTLREEFCELSYEFYYDLHEDLEYLQQVILKSEWKRLKLESKKGKEIPNKKMKKIFKEVGEEINKNKYIELMEDTKY
ncbi:hypothetical protein J0K78_03250 [Halobacillus sp. GSS1]|uniref:hypothetical protein n=1 Tax=Halobacillus sp. GSS1 TaxID=2815919 RepID=UPI001A8F9768|nr:hypothetical protein [Halobacillus sp. GSS1]MBN9653270.1 hypothetical protein [Halobacillus sp. GSS1]